MNTTYILVVILVIAVVLVIGLYNQLITLKNQIKEALSGIDVQLKRRIDLIPNLVETVKGYAKHEKSVFENVTKARSQLMKAGSMEDTEDKIAYSRQFYNANVLEYNTKVKVFPNSMVANMFGFHEEAFFAATEEERKAVGVNF